MNQKPLRLLLAEDSDDDALLVLNELRRQGHAVESLRVMTADDFRSALETGGFDLILCDYVMPSFMATDALEILRESGKDIPLIVVSGVIGEDVAVEAMRLGAADYILKNNLIRIGAAVDREIREAEGRRRKRLLDLFSQSQTEVLEMILKGVALPVILGGVVERVEEHSSEEVICSILLANAAGTELEFCTMPGPPPAFRQLPVPVPISVAGELTTGEDITTRPGPSEKHEWSVPVFSSAGRILGAMVIHHRSHHLPDAEEIRWVESASKLVSLAIERSQDADKLRENGALLRIASSAAHIGGWTVDFPESRITWSDEVCAIHGMPPGTVPGFDQAFEFYAPEYRGAITRTFEQCLFDGLPFDEEMEIITADGRRVWVRTVGERILDENGQVSRVQGAFQDISEKKLAQEKEERLAARLSATLESLTDAFFILDQEWCFSYVNKQAEQLMQRSREDLLGRSIWDEFPGLGGTNFEMKYRRADELNLPIELMEYYAPLERWFEVRVFPSPEGLAVGLHDVTERLRAQEQLKLLENCVSRINDIVIITDGTCLDEPGPRIIFVNDAFERRTGYSREEVIGKSPRFLQGDETQRSGLDLIRTALEHSAPVRTELINYTKSGEKLWLDIDIVPVMDETGVTKHLVAVERDVSERKKNEETLRANQLRYLQQRNALIALTGIDPHDNDGILTAFRRITETSARTLGVSRVSIWRYSGDRALIECVDLYELGADLHSSGVKLHATDYPFYFQGLSEMELIAADDAHNNPYTREFSQNYLTPLGINSMLDAPIHFGSAVGYILCNEHVGEPRRWTEDEKTFVIAVANVVSLALEAHERARAEKEVLQSHQRFQSVAAATNDTIWDWDLRTDSFWWNDGFARLFGWSATETEPNINAWIRQIHPEDRDRVVSGIYAAIDGGGTHWTDEYRFMSNDGAIAHVLDRGQIIRDADGKGIRMVGGMMDLSAQKSAQLELARSHRSLQMLSSCNELLIRATDENALLADVCRLAVDVGGYRMAWVGYAVDEPEHRITSMAHAGEGAGELAEIETGWGGDVSGQLGLIGQTIRLGKMVVCEDVARDSALSPWSKEARSSGSKCVISLPLSNERRTFGVIILFAGKLHEEGGDELKLLGQMAKDLSFGIQNIRVRMERQRTQEVVLKVAQAVSSGVGAEFFDLLTRNMVEALGADAGVVGQYDALNNSIDTMSFILDGIRMENITYSLLGTPCENVMAGDICIFPRGVQQLFPSDHFLIHHGIESYAGIPLFDQDDRVSGVMVVIFRKPLKDTALVESTLRIFAVRAASELDRQQADALIREQASLLDKAQDAIIVRDLNHAITFWNKSAERLYGWSASEVIGRLITDLLYRDTVVFDQAFEHTIRTGEWVGEMRHMTKYGRDLIIESRWTLVRDAKGNPQSFLVIDTDVSEHRKLEQQFLRAQRLESIGTLAGGIAHDLNNILAPISMAIELLKMRIPDARGSELLDTIAASAKRGTDMISQVLSFARGMEGRRLEIHPMQLISEVEKIMRDTFLKNIRLLVKTSRDLWTIQGDPTQLHQVLINLCVNARDAVEENGEIAIIAGNVEIDASFAAMNLEAKVGPHICIQIEDDGTGIPPDILDKIFDPFFTTKSPGKGTGLGLSTSLAIVKSHGGFIRTSSDSGKGTSFKVYLPARPELGIHVPPQENPDLPLGNGETILIVDDESFIRQITRETLETFGYQTRLAANGDEAVSIFTLNPGMIDLVLTDMMMPGMNGATMIGLMMEIDPAVRIVATSGISTNSELAFSAGDGVKGFLPKPCTAETLLKCLREVLAGQPGKDSH